MNRDIVAKNKVKSCIITFAGNRQVDFTSALRMPIFYNEVLDETLDTAQIVLSDLRTTKDYSVDVTKAFEPLTVVTIRFEDDNCKEQKTDLKMIVAHDDCRMQRKDNTAWKSYTHTIQLIEQTKELERLSLDVLTFTNPVERKYDVNANANWSIV